MGCWYCPNLGQCPSCMALPRRLPFCNPVMMKKTRRRLSSSGQLGLARPCELDTLFRLAFETRLGRKENRERGTADRSPRGMQDDAAVVFADQVADDPQP